MYSDTIISRQAHLTFISGLKKNRKNLYWFVKNISHEYIGVISLTRIDFRNQSAFLGIYTNPYVSLPGKGKFLIDCLKYVGFRKIGLHTMKLEVIKNNARAKIFYQKQGFKKEGELIDFYYKKGTWQNVLIMGLRNT